MIRKLVLAAVWTAATSLSCPAFGQEQASALAAPAATSSSSPEAGYRKAEALNGFQLVEHGIWPTAAPNPGPDVPKSLLSNTYVESTRNVPSNFRRAAYLPHIYAAEFRHALPVGLLDALVWTESRYDPLAVSKAGAAGLGQLMPGTARELGVTNRFDPLENLSGAAKYLRQMLDRFGVVHLALAAYNAGPGAVERARGIPRNGETPAYVRNVLRRWRP